MHLAIEYGILSAEIRRRFALHGQNNHEFPKTDTDEELPSL